MRLSKPKLRALRKQLPLGYLEKLHESNGMSKSTISMVLGGSRHNTEILLAAIKLRDQHQAELKKLEDQI